MRAERIHAALAEDKIVLVAGFQGVSTATHDVTTLGRGGSDTTAVALAAALGADACEIFTDVPGVFTADPRIVPGALKLDSVTYEEMLEMSASGAKVMALRSIEVARSYGVKLRVRSTFVDGEGTWIGEEDAAMLEKAIISGVTHDTSEAKVVILGAPDQPGVAARVFRALADAGVNIDMIVQNVSEDGATSITFTLPKTDLPVAEPIIDATAREIGATGVVRDPGHREDLADRRRHEEPPGRGRRHVRRARRGGHQHRDHLDVVDPHLLRDPRLRGRARACRPSTSGSGRSPRSVSVSDRPAIGVVGATGAVGSVTLELLEAAATTTCASSPRPARRAGSSAASPSRRRRPRRSRAATSTSSSSRSAPARRRELVPHAVRGGAVAIDKSAAYRLEPGVPLVVPEVNADRALEHTGIVANPNCCAIPLTCVLKPLHDAAGLVRVRVATYQSVSGAGAQAMERLANEAPAEHDLRMDWSFDGEEFEEESKLRAETQKIMELPDLPIQATCVRVPVMVGHAEAVWVEFEDDLSPEQRPRAARRGAVGGRRGLPVARQGRGRRRRAGRPDPPRPDRRARPRALPGRRQPAQGRSAERDPDRRARARRARAAAA